MELTAVALNSPYPLQTSGDMCVENAVYDALLAAYNRSVDEREDLAQAGSSLVSWLTNLLKDQSEFTAKTIQNGMILLLALFFLRDDQFGLRGKDIATLDSEDKARVFEELAAAEVVHT